MKSILHNIYILLLTLLLPLNLYSKDKDFVVVIDAGHGGHDYGAIDNGTNEKSINLGVALKLGNLIKKELKDIIVVYTRDNDSFVSLQGRADIANKSKGDLFISIHTNSVDKANKNRTSVAGATVYALGLHKDNNNMNVAQRENSVITLEGDFEQKYQGFDPSKDESYIIFEMAQKKNLSKSIKFANDVQKELVKTAERRDRGVHQAGFWVLWATSMPAVLIELDFICNPTSAQFISSENGQEKLAKAIFNAVKDYYQKSQTDNTIKPSPQQKQREIDAEKKRLENKKNKELKFSKKKSGKNADRSDNLEYNENNAVVLTSNKSGKTRHHLDNNNKNTTATQRRRRSENARNISANRQVEKAIIQDNISQSTVKEENGKNDAVITTNVEKQAKNVTKTTKKRHSKVQHLESVYSIQIFASPEKIKEKDPRFAGLSPIRVVKENNLYKYSYGNSTDRSEMEKLLKKIKKSFSDAFIIENKKSSK